MFSPVETSVSHRCMTVLAGIARVPDGRDSGGSPPSERHVVPGGVRPVVGPEFAGPPVLRFESL